VEHPAARWYGEEVEGDIGALPRDIQRVANKAAERNRLAKAEVESANISGWYIPHSRLLRGVHVLYKKSSQQSLSIFAGNGLHVRRLRLEM